MRAAGFRVIFSRRHAWHFVLPSCMQWRESVGCTAGRLQLKCQQGSGLAQRALRRFPITWPVPRWERAAPRTPAHVERAASGSLLPVSACRFHHLPCPPALPRATSSPQLSQLRSLLPPFQTPGPFEYSNSRGGRQCVVPSSEPGNNRTAHHFRCK